MIVLKIALGLAGLGVVVFVHELGHFLAARWAGIDVEAFSIGWGRPLVKKKIGAVEYRLGMFPIGGYCKMRGENEFKEAWDNSTSGMEQTAGTFFGVRPGKRIVVAFAGPFFNFLFAVLTLSVIWGRGIEVETPENRIVLVSDINGKKYPADEGGLLSGDRIISINKKEIRTYRDVQENIAVNPGAELAVTVLRNGRDIALSLRPLLDESGMGKIGVYHWTEPVVNAVRPGGPAEEAGLKPGDRILSLDGKPLPYTVAAAAIFSGRESETFTVEYERNGTRETAEFRGVRFKDGFPDLGVEYPLLRYKTPALSPFGALARGSAEAAKTFAISVKSLSLLFRGVDLTQAVSGPARITYMAGDIAAEGFGQSIETGFFSFANFLALISIALCFMNLLPLPVLDGGLIVLFLIEALRRKPLHPRAVSVFQTAGVVIICSLMVFAVFNDILFFTGR